jgi:hypothetical protein
LKSGKENFKAWLAENLDTAVPGWNKKAKFSTKGKPQAATSRGGAPSIIHPDDFDAKMRQFKRAFPGVQIIGHDSDTVPPTLAPIRASVAAICPSTSASAARVSAATPSHVARISMSAWPTRACMTD